VGSFGERAERLMHTILVFEIPLYPVGLHPSENLISLNYLSNAYPRPSSRNLPTVFFEKHTDVEV
jgi:hypothetical protein